MRKLESSKPHTFFGFDRKWEDAEHIAIVQSPTCHVAIGGPDIYGLDELSPVVVQQLIDYLDRNNLGVPYSVEFFKRIPAP